MTNLSRAPGLQVVSRELAFQHSLANETVQAIGSTLGARYVLDGSVQRIGERIRVTASLYETPGGDVRYTYERDQPVAKILDIQDAVIAAVLSELKVRLDDKQTAEMHDWGTQNVGAYLAAATGVYFTNQGYDFRTLEFAASKFREAIQLDPAFFFAYHQLANVLGDYGTSVTSGTKRRSEIRQELASMRETVARLDPTSSALKGIQFAETRLEETGNLWSQLEGQARSQIQAAGPPQQADYNYAVYSDYLLTARLFKEAEAFLGVYERFDPSNPMVKVRQSGIVAVTEGPARGLPAAEEIPRLMPTYVWPMVTVSGQHSLLGQYDAADRIVARMREIDANEGKDYTYTAWMINAILRGDLKAGMKELDEVASQRDVVEFPRGLAYLIAGDIDSGLALWRKIRPEHRENMYRSTIGAEQYIPAWVTADPRYQVYLEEIGIGASWTRFMYEKVAELAPITGVQPISETPQSVLQIRR